MGRVRPFVQDDIPEVASLYLKVFGKGGNTSRQSQLGYYMEEIFFHNPWRDASLPSLVCEGANRKIVGFLGVIPRRMSIRGRSLRVAVGTSFMVEPASHRTLTSLELGKAFFAGPQDLSFTDTANDLSRKLWERAGGVAVPIYGIDWIRILRPARYAGNFLGKTRRLLRPFMLALSPLCWIADFAAAKKGPYRLRRSELPFSEENVDAKVLVDNLPQLLAGLALRPEYDYASLNWILDKAQQKQTNGRLRMNVVRNAEGQIMGWSLYYLNIGGVSQVLQIVALEKFAADVLDNLFYSAWKQGSSGIYGPGHPRLLRELSQCCQLTTGGWMLVHSRDSEVLQAIYQCDAFLSRLEGDYWTRFIDFV